MTQRTFGAWLAQQTHRSDTVGELARHYATPCPCTPCTNRISRRYSVNGVREELTSHAATRPALEALDQAATEWQAIRPQHPSKTRREP